MGLFPIDAIDGDEVTNTYGTTFKYVAVDDKWIILNTITIDNTPYDEATWNNNSDAATKDTLRDKFESLAGSRKVIISAPFLPRTEEMFNGSRIDLIAQGTDYVGINFLVHADIVDDTEEILFIWVYRTLVTDATFAMHRFRAAIKSDNSEVFSWNLDSAVAFNMNVTANKINTETYTFAVADYDAGDHLYSLLKLNDAAGDMYIEGCYIVFYIK